MFGKLFAPHSRIWNICNNITDVLGLSTLWFFCCLPILTLGPATVALYDAAVRGIRTREGSVYRRFLRTFRRELKTGLLISLLWLPLLALGFFALTLLGFAAEENPAADLYRGIYSLLMLLPLAAFSWSCIILSRFQMSFGAVTAAAVRFLPAHPLASVLLAAALWASLWFCTYCYFLPVFFLPAVCALCWSLPGEKVLAKYSGAESRFAEA